MRKNFDNTKRKEELNRKIEAIRADLESIRNIENDLKSALWLKIKGKAVSDFDQIDEKLFNFEKFTDREIVGLLGQRKKIVEILSVENFVKMKEKFEEKLTDVRKQLADFKDQHE